jgi:hypothetical protein
MTLSCKAKRCHKRDDVAMLNKSSDESDDTPGRSGGECDDRVIVPSNTVSNAHFDLTITDDDENRLHRGCRARRKSWDKSDDVCDDG